METTDLIENYVSNYFTIKSVYREPKSFYFVVYEYNREKFLQLVGDLDKIGYLPFIDEFEDNYKISIANKPESGESKVHLNIFLFLVTIVTTISAGYLFRGSIIEGIAFSIAIIAIVGAHETAHFFAAKKHHVKATLPYFVPAPTLIGTFGAVINVKSAIPDKNALFDLGVSGPIVGFIVTIPVLIIGIFLSTVAPLQPNTMTFYPPLLMQIIMYFISPQIPPGYELFVHPVAFAGWVGIIITMLNLMPVAVLDGGHISRSIFNMKIHQYVSIIGIIVTVLLGWYAMAILMAVFILFMAKTHPGALDNVSKLSRNRKIIAILTLAIFILCLTPAPLAF
ncbi:site-2 protease family protein [Methanobacterium sp.]|uniref:site-2 protease family protein n=1 Tax=Methanobacterium sp. TaxID=2164 RepID=UPI003C776F30